jgi:hypothetical protein
MSSRGPMVTGKVPGDLWSLEKWQNNQFQGTSGDHWNSRITDQRTEEREN